MEGDNGSLFSADSAEKTMELAGLQKELEEKESKIQGLKKERDEIKQYLEKKQNVSKERMDAFRVLIEKYTSLRTEYMALSANESRETNE